MTPLRLLASAAVLAVAAPAALAAEPSVRAPSAIVIDAADGEVLYEKNADDRRQIASTTKLMTALLTIERAKRDDVFTAAPYAAGAAESKINLRRGERMAVRDLTTALMLESANDAAATLAEGISGSRERFVRDMNARATELGLADTSFSNPIGFDDARNYSTATDLAALSRRLLADRALARTVDLPRAELRSGARRRVVANRNDLIARYDFVDGVKTGHTRRAGYLLVGAAEGRGAKVVSVVMGEPSEAARDTDSLALLRYGIDQFRRPRAAVAGRTYAEADVKYFDRDVALTVPDSVALTVRRGERAQLRVDPPTELEGPMRAGARVGSVRVVYRGKTVERLPLVTAADVPSAGAPRKLLETLGLPLTSLLIMAILAGVALSVLRLRTVGRERRRIR
ncbi:MAG: D-alanyl-D-alanine carboxypeptidase [Thermoleophilaceae bacterium]|nr:D-alanyl-D-alanine carboxypeptidase [Thermoleophilaceae bacterium]